MLRFGIAASLLSLGAIDFGMIVDSSVVMIENCVRHIAHGDLNKKSKLEMIRDAAVEVRKPTLFGELIIMIVYLPILTLEGIEGKLFRPMALTVIFALAGSMILSMTLMPVLASLLLAEQDRARREPFFMRIAHAIHYPILRFSMEHKAAVIGVAVVVLVVAFGFIAPNLGSEFVPTLSEGAIDHQHRATRRHADRALHRRKHAPGTDDPARLFPTRSNTSGAASAPPKSRPTRWASS